MARSGSPSEAKLWNSTCARLTESDWDSMALSHPLPAGHLQDYFAQIADILARVGRKQKQVGALAGLDRAALLILMQGHGPIAGRGHDYIEGRHTSLSQAFGSARHIGSVRSQRHGYSGPEETFCIVWLGWACGHPGGIEDPQIAQSGEEIRVQGLAIANCPYEPGDAVFHQELRFRQGGDVPDDGDTGGARLFQYG